MNDMLFQKIFDKIADVLPQEWSKTVFYAAYMENGYSMKFYVCGSDKEYRSCYDLDEVSDNRLTELFIDINKDIQAVREGLSGKEKWNILTLNVNREGSFKADFDYSNIDENFISYEYGWKERYLI